MAPFQKTLKNTQATTSKTDLVKTKRISSFFLLPFLFAFFFMCGCNNGIDSRWQSERGTTLNNAFSQYGGINGDPVWGIPKNKAVRNMIMDQSSILYYVLGNDQVEALNEANTPTPTVKWTYSANRNIITPLCMDDDYTVFFGCNDNTINMVRDGVLLWHYNFLDQITAAPLVYNGNVFIGLSNGAVYSLTYEIGKQKINLVVKCNGPILSLTCAGGRLFVVSEDNNVYAFDVSGNDNKPPSLWTKPLGGKGINVLPCLPPNGKYLLVPFTNNGHAHIRAYNPADGTPIWDYENSEDFYITSMCANNERLFIEGPVRDPNTRNVTVGIKALSLRSGLNLSGLRVEWEINNMVNYSEGCKLVIDAKGRLYFGDQMYITALNEKDKTEIWKKKITSVTQNYTLGMIIGGEFLYVNVYNSPESGSNDPRTIFSFK